jgi:AraC-like DNA-binding protein
MREHGGLAIFDQLHLRVFEAEFRPIKAHSWQSQNVLDTFWRFYFNFRDGAFIKSNENTFCLRANVPYFVPAGVRFSCSNLVDIDHFYVHFDVLGWPGHQLRTLFASPVEVPSDKVFRQEISSFARRLPTSRQLDMVQQCRLKSLLWQAFARYLEELPVAHREIAGLAATDKAVVWPALGFIEENLGGKISNAQLAALCHWSEDYFILRFRECVGQPPAQYIAERRVERAAQMLLFSTSSIENIAECCGFPNRFYFSRVFTRHTGVAPGAYRKLSRL